MKKANSMNVVGLACATLLDKTFDSNLLPVAPSERPVKIEDI
jgi:hypothetical protein